MKNVMKRACEIYKELVGDHIAKLAMAMKQAWAEIKNAAKKQFGGFAKVAKKDDIYGECCYLFFKLWEKYGKKRIYINDYKRRTLGYIENGNVIINDNHGNTNEEIECAINGFMSEYAF